MEQSYRTSEWLNDWSNLYGADPLSMEHLYIADLIYMELIYGTELSHLWMTEWLI